MGISRRSFLGFSTGAVAGTVAGVSVSRTLSEVIAAADTPFYPPRGPEDFALSVCKLCPGGCGIRVRRIDGRAVKIDGNPLHPVSGGRLCPKGQAALQSLLHPDRIAGPMRRIGPRGSLESFERVTWEEALLAITERLQLLRRVGRPESLALLRGSQRGLGARVGQRFLRAFGSPNDIVLDRGEEAAALAVYFTQGVRKPPVYDLEATDYVLSFGGALLEAWSSPVHTTRAYGKFRQGRPGRRGKLVQAESRLSMTGASGDEWIEVRPGTEGILALGVAQVIVAEGLYDREFVRNRCSGFFDAPGTGRKNLDLRAFLADDYGLERVAAATGIANDLILRIAREFAAARSQLAVGPRKGPLVPGSLFDHLAVHTLNALVGNPDRQGGVLLADDAPMAPLPDLPPDPVADAGLAKPRLDYAGDRFGHLESDPEGLAEGLVSGSRYPLEVLIVQGTDPLFSSVGPARFAQALDQIPLIVSLASLPDDTSLMADWILPEAHFLETWDLDTTPPGVPFPVVSLSQPIAKQTRLDVKPAAEIFFALARQIGQEVAAAFPWADLQALVRTEAEGLFAARRGAIIGTEFDEAWVRMMERAGWWAPGYRSRQELWNGMKATGGWWDPFYDHGDWDRVLRTDSGRFDFRVDLLSELAPKRIAHTIAEVKSPNGHDPLLALVLFEPLAVSGGIGAELPFLQGLLDPGLEESWNTWAEIHPKTAAHLAVRDKEWIRLTSDAGAIEVRARVTPRVVEGAVAVPVGLGKTAGGRWASGVGANPLRLLDTARDPVSGLPDLASTRVRVAVIGRSVGRTVARS